MSQFLPIPDPHGSLGPPNRHPPTTVALATPEPEGRPAAAGRLRGWRGAALRLLDAADEVGAAIRRALRLG